MTYGSERRRHLRAEIQWSITITQQDLFVDGITKNISHSGALICCDHKLSPGESARIAFELPDRLPIVVDAEVTRSNITSSDFTCGLFETGVRFVAVSREDLRLIDFAVSEILCSGSKGRNVEEPQESDSSVSIDESHEDKRRYPRAEVSWPATMTTPTGPVEVIAQNVSCDGAFVRCSEETDLGDAFGLIIESPQGKLIRALARKVWSDIFTTRDSIFQGVGVSFVYIPDDDRHALGEMICELSK